MHRIFALLLAAASAAAAQPQPADGIVTARYVLTMDREQRVIIDGAVAVRGARIAAVGTRAAIERDFRAARRVDRPNAILMPGLVNTHAHAPMSLLRGLADDLRLQDWLERYIFPAEARNVTPDFVRWGTLLACLEMMLSGTTTYADMYYFEETIAEATREAGLRGVLGQTIIGFPAPDARTPAEALTRAEAFLKRFAGDDWITPAVAPHALYTNSAETLRASRALANRYGAPLLIHLAETRRERDEAIRKHKLSPVAYLDSLGVFEGRTLAAHGVWVDDHDIGILQRRGAGVAHCPSSNMKLSSGVAPVGKYLELGVALGLGTDGPAGTNNDFHLMEEMDLACKLQKVHTLDPTALPAREALRMATIGGARALGLDLEIGSLEAGKRADLITLRLDGPHAAPLYHVPSQVVYALKSSDVRDVMVNGRWIVRDRVPLTLNARDVLAKAAEYGARIQTSLR